MLNGATVAMPTFGVYDADDTWSVEGQGFAPGIEVVDDPSDL